MHKSTSDALNPPKSIKTAVRFCVLVILLILVGLLVHFIVTVTQRTFDGQHRFTVAVSQKDGRADILSFVPESQEVSIIHVTGSHSSLGRDLSIPIDAKVFISHTFAVDDPRAFMSYLSGHLNETRTIGMNSVDVTALLWFCEKIKPENIKVKTVSLPANTAITLSSLMSDNTLYGEGKSISVINATGESGIGSRMTRLITNMGGNVISVTTAPEIQAVSTISYYGEKSYTLTRLAGVLHFTLVPMSKQTFSDIIITIGTNSIDAQEF